MAFTCIACKREIDPSGRNCPHCGEPITDFLRTYMVQLIDGKYKIIERLGRGGMGEVYKVLHTRLGAIRVIKTMRPHLLEDESLHERFLREAKLATRIQHQNVAVLHDFSQLPDNSLYMVWEYIEGTNLAAMVRREGRLKPRVAIDVAIQTLLGLQAIHEAGIIHRDISPENIMVFREPSGSLRVKVIDLGIAKSEAVDGAVTRTGMFVGKWKYASPEHLGFLPEGLVIDGRADLFSFGIVLYEMLAGRAPYEATTPGQYFILHSKETPNPVTLANLSFPEAPGLEKILARALEKDREQRFPSAKEFARELSALLAKLVEADGEQTAILQGGAAAGAQAAVAAEDRTAPIVRTQPLPPPVPGPIPAVHPAPPPVSGTQIAPPIQGELAPTIAERPMPAPPVAVAPVATAPPPVSAQPVAQRPVAQRPVAPQATARPKSSPAMIAAAVVVVAIGIGLLGAAFWFGYSRWSGGSTQQAANTATTTPATDPAQSAIPAGVTPPEGQAAAQPGVAQGADAQVAATTPPAAATPTPTTTQAPPPTVQYQAPVAPPPAPVQTRTPPSAPATPPAAAQPTALPAVPVANGRPTPSNPPSGGATLPATVVPAGGAAAPNGTAKPGTKPEPPPTPAPAAKPPAVEAAPASDAIPDAGSLGWRSKALTASGEWKTGFQRGIIKNYEDMYSGSPALWAAIAPGVKLSQSKVVVGKVQNLSGLDRPQLQAAFPAGLQTSIDGEVGTKPTAIVNAQLAVIAALDDDKQGHSLVVEMIFRDAQGKVLAKLHHRTEGRDFDGAVEDMVTELTDFVTDHPVVSVKKVK